MDSSSTLTASQCARLKEAYFFSDRIEKESVMKLSRVGVDLAKNVYQLHGVDRHGKAIWKRRLRRAQWLQALLDNTDPGCQIGMEACTGAHHWA
jgi:hypothetical protein